MPPISCAPRMRSGNVTLVNRWGMHARLAFHFAAEAARFRCAIRLGAGGNTADGKEIMSLLMLEAMPGDELRLETEGGDEEAAYEALTRFLREGALLL